MNNLALVSSKLKSEILRIDQIITSAAEGANEPLVDEVIKHIAKAGGKRLRPLFTLISAKIFSDFNENAVLLAAAVEFIHTATLLHDDVIDKSTIRRGLKTANDLWGNKTSILVGDYLFSQAFKLMIKTESLEALNCLAAASSLISKAEVSQLRLIGMVEMQMGDYVKLVTEKTAMLFAAACQVGAIVAGAKKYEVKNLYTYGLNFGIVFQIIDDYLDYFGQEESLGKQIGGDFLENKITLPIILLKNYCTPEEKDFLSQAFTNGYSKTVNELQKTINLLNKYDIITAVKSIADSYLKECLDALQELPQNEFVNYMDIMAQDSLKRIR
ncbi:MAG: polyprenyl synthetase family protein [Candidatus Midichloria sp.]|nr:MAG: polyprenyl synthetase family protein [Candidatus Midichloria sp.]